MTFKASDFRPIATVLATGLALCVAAFFVVRGYYLGQDRQQFQSDVAYYGANFKAEMSRHVNSLAAIHAFVSASHTVSRWEFSNFAHQILPQNSGFKAVLWLPRVGQAERKSFEASLQSDGLYGLKIRRLSQQGVLQNAENHPDYLPVAFVEPFEASGSLIGVDLLDNPIYAPLFAAAQRSGKLTVSAPLSRALVQGTDAPIMLVIFPLNRQGTAQPAARKAGKNRLEGYALGVLQLNRVIQRTFGSRSAIEAAISYGPRKTVYQSGLSAPLDRWFGNAEFQHLEPFTIAGQHFFLAMRSARHGNILTRVYVPIGAALLVLALTALLVQSMMATMLRKQEVERAVIERTRELQEINDTLELEIVQKRSAETQLRIAKEKAEAANRAKSAFLSTMSHELRTPLNAIIGFSALLLGNAEQFDARTRDYLRETNASGIKLLDLINDVLEITLMDTEEGGSDDLVYLCDLIDAAIDKSQSAAEAAGISLERDLDESLPALRGDSRRLQKALINLLSNAIKFNGKGGWARITAHLDADGLEIKVTDNGLGMPAEAQAQIVGLFSQYDSSLARRHEGVGLGLTFVRRVADRHDAILKIESRLGSGTSVSMRFPQNRTGTARRAA